MFGPIISCECFRKELVVPFDKKNICSNLSGANLTSGTYQEFWSSLCLQLVCLSFTHGMFKAKSVTWLFFLKLTLYNWENCMINIDDYEIHLRIRSYDRFRQFDVAVRQTQPSARLPAIGRHWVRLVKLADRRTSLAEIPSFPVRKNEMDDKRKNYCFVHKFESWWSRKQKKRRKRTRISVRLIWQTQTWSKCENSLDSEEV